MVDSRGIMSCQKLKCLDFVLVEMHYDLANLEMDQARIRQLSNGLCQGKSLERFNLHVESYPPCHPKRWDILLRFRPMLPQIKKIKLSGIVTS